MPSNSADFMSERHTQSITEHDHALSLTVSSSRASARCSHSRCAPRAHDTQGHSCAMMADAADGNDDRDSASGDYARVHTHTPCAGIALIHTFAPRCGARLCAARHFPLSRTASWCRPARRFGLDFFTAAHLPAHPPRRLSRGLLPSTANAPPCCIVNFV